MGQTITEKIFSEHAGREVKAGEIVRVDIDMIIGNDITTPISIEHLKRVVQRNWHDRITFVS